MFSNGLEDSSRAAAYSSFRAGMGLHTIGKALFEDFACDREGIIDEVEGIRLRIVGDIHFYVFLPIHQQP